MRRGSRGVVVVVCAVFVALVAGCSGSADAGPPPPSPVSPTAVTSSPTASATPSGLTDEAAVAVAKAYYAAFNEGLKTRDSKTFRSMTTGACIPCSRDADFIDSLATADRRVKGGDIAFALATSHTVTHRFGGVFIGMKVHSRAATVTDRSGAIVDTFDESKTQTVYLDLFARHGHWLVRGIS